MKLPDKNEQTVESSGDGISRRNVLRTVGAGAVAGTGLVAATGTASAHHINKATFCGCSQVCVCGEGNLIVYVAWETDTGYQCDTVEYEHGSEEEYGVCHEEDDKKVIAVEDGDGNAVYCNPHEPCAGDALDACDYKFDCQYYGQSGGPCGGAFLKTCHDGEHPGQGQGPSDDHPGKGQGKGKGKGKGKGN